MTAILKLFDLIPSWLYALAVAALVTVIGLQELHVGALKVEVAAAQSKASKLEVQIETDRAAAAEQRAKDEASARKKEQDLQSEADQLRSRKDAEIARLRADVRDLRYGLQYLPARPKALSGSAQITSVGQTPAGCPGPVLYREIGEDLVSEAERAETVRLELVRVYELWDKARTTLNTAP